ncbi:MAG TPA: RNA polymerase sigma factor [bacterium]|nr:RNA polymerase sigma factor [bacterium]HPP29397.1 RNA polymerase sigma factor [bacterium]
MPYEKKIAFEGFYKEYAGKLYGVAFRLVNNRQDAMDIVQESFVRAYQNWEKFRNESAVSTWMYKITLNLSYDFLKKRSRNGTLPVEKDFEDERLHISEKNIIESDMADNIKKEIDNLTPKQKAVFILKCYEELTYEEIARITKSRVGTVKATYFQVIQKIKKNLGGKKNGM